MALLGGEWDGWLALGFKARGHRFGHAICDSSGCFPRGHLLCKYGPWEQYNKIVFKYNRTVLNTPSEAGRDRMGNFPWIASNQ